MSKSKIDSWEATRLGTSIAAKAFEHLTSPIQTQIENHLRECYHKLIPPESYAYLADRGVIVLTDRITFKVPHEDGFIDVWVVGDTEEFLTSSWRGNEFKFRDASEVPEFARLLALVLPLRAQEEKLAKELASQLNGQSAAKAIKAWPEAAEIIRSQFDMELPPGEMEKPLEVLLAKFLPALPAPTNVTE